MSASSLPPGKAVHFGAGALGRGLVIPRLVGAKWAVTLMDADSALVSALADARGYPLTVTEDPPLRTTTRVAAALEPSNPLAAKAISEATLITTAVRRENLTRVARTTVAAWNSEGMPDAVAIVGCENVEKVDEVLAAAFEDARIDEAQRARLFIPRTVVDRICAAEWPASLEVITEPFNQLSIQAGRTIPGIDTATDIDAAFDTKRYLVNTFADASAILGLARKHATLAECVRDPEIQRVLAPLLDALREHLRSHYALSAEALAEYLEQSRTRLGNPGIPRRIETVARDIWRKLAPSERFAAPLISLQTENRLDDKVIEVMAELVRAGAGEPTTSMAEAYQGAILSDAARQFYQRIEKALQR